MKEFYEYFLKTKFLEFDRADFAYFKQLFMDTPKFKLDDLTRMAIEKRVLGKVINPKDRKICEFILNDNQIILDWIISTEKTFREALTVEQEQKLETYELLLDTDKFDINNPKHKSLIEYILKHKLQVRVKEFAV